MTRCHRRKHQESTQEAPIYLETIIFEFGQANIMGVRYLAIWQRKKKLRKSGCGLAINLQIFFDKLYKNLPFFIATKKKICSSVIRVRSNTFGYPTVLDRYLLATISCYTKCCIRNKNFLFVKIES